MEELKPACAEAERDYFGRKQRRIVALREPDLSEFTGAEIALVDEPSTASGTMARKSSASLPTASSACAQQGYS